MPAGRRDKQPAVSALARTKQNRKDHAVSYRLEVSDATLEKPTIESLAAELRQLQQRLEDMKDLMELRAAVERNAGNPGTPWEQVRTELDID